MHSLNVMKQLLGGELAGMEDYVIQVADTPQMLDAVAWDALLQCQSHPTPFMQHAYLSALHNSLSAGPDNGWEPRFLTLTERGGPHPALVAATALFIKHHSYGEYVFDWAWASAYEQHGLAYYPKGVVAVPFTPVPGSRLLARSATERSALMRVLLALCRACDLSSLHLLFSTEADVAAAADAGLMLRHGVQFHWRNRTPVYRTFDEFLASLAQDKRKKIRQERRKVSEAGVVFRHSTGHDITASDWAFFYRCYERTYLEHGNAPYLTPDFFRRLAHDMPTHWLLFIAERDGVPIASSLVALSQPMAHTTTAPSAEKVAYGRYWGALERVDCLHFEACYYQPLNWCIEHGYSVFEGGAQGEHKMARALMPVQTTSAHWIAHPAFANAVAHFLEQERLGIDNYAHALAQRNPFRNGLEP